MADIQTFPAIHPIFIYPANSAVPRCHIDQVTCSHRLCGLTRTVQYNPQQINVTRSIYTFSKQLKAYDNEPRTQKHMLIDSYTTYVREMYTEEVAVQTLQFAASGGAMLPIPQELRKLTDIKEQGLDAACNILTRYMKSSPQTPCDFIAPKPTIEGAKRQSWIDAFPARFTNFNAPGLFSPNDQCTNIIISHPKVILPATADVAGGFRALVSPVELSRLMKSDYAIGYYWFGWFISYRYVAKREGYMWLTIPYVMFMDPDQPAQGYTYAEIQWLFMKEWTHTQCLESGLRKLNHLYSPATNGFLPIVSDDIIRAPSIVQWKTSFLEHMPLDVTLRLAVESLVISVTSSGDISSNATGSCANLMEVDSVPVGEEDDEDDDDDDGGDKLRRENTEGVLEEGSYSDNMDNTPIAFQYPDKATAGFSLIQRSPPTSPLVRHGTDILDLTVPRDPIFDFSNSPFRIRRRASDQMPILTQEFPSAVHPVQPFQVDLIPTTTEIVRAHMNRELAKTQDTADLVLLQKEIDLDIQISTTEATLRQLVANRSEVKKQRDEIKRKTAVKVRDVVKRTKTELLETISLLMDSYEPST